MKYHSLLFGIMISMLLFSCEEEKMDVMKIHSQKYVDSTLKAFQDSLEKSLQQYYDSLLQKEAESIADSLLKTKTPSAENEFDLKIPKPSTKNLPEPTGPEYKFPEEVE